MKTTNETETVKYTAPVLHPSHQDYRCPGIRRVWRFRDVPLENAKVPGNGGPVMVQRAVLVAATASL